MSEPYRWNREQYYRLDEIDVFDGERVELLNGEIWKLGQQSPPHAATVYQTSKALRGIMGAGFVISPKMPVSLTDTCEPEPDVSLAVGVIDDFAGHHPGPSEIVLLVEVADDTLVKDRGLKRGIYASSGIQDYWIVNVNDCQVEVYRQPSPDGIYADIRVYLLGDSIELLSLPGKMIAVADLLPFCSKENNESI